MNLDMFKQFLQYSWKPVLEILIITFIVYKIVSFIRGTRAAQLLKGLIIIVIMFLISQKLELYTINWLLTKVFAFSVIALLIIFQPELRRGLANIGQNSLFGNILREEGFIGEIIKAVTILSKKKIGALIVVEQSVGLRNYVESGITLDSNISSELLVTIFMPTTPLHDGAVIIQGEKIAASGCLLPLTTNPNVSKTLGTRHRAAIGITEESDAVCIVLSEKTGIVSFVEKGRIKRDLEIDNLKKLLAKSLFKNMEKKKT
jgi:diadenylate cyclase